MRTKLLSGILLTAIFSINVTYGTKPFIADIEKPIVIRTSFAANYLWHLMAVAQISYTSEYATDYMHTVQPDDLEFLQEHATYIAFRDGNTGPFTWLLIFLPSYLELTDKAAFEEYFSLVTQGLATLNFSALKQRYQQANWQDPFVEIASGIFYVSEEYKERVSQVMPVFEKFTKVITNNLETYHTLVWQKAQSSMQSTKDTLSAYFSQNDIIGNWEKKMGTSFEADRYDIILCYACKYGPNANTLSYDKNVFYYDYELDHTTQFISHETGTHILFHEYLELYHTQEYDSVDLYAAYESLLMWYNHKVLNTDTLSYRLSQFHDTYYHEIYDRHYTPGVSPLYLLEKALKK